LARPLRRKALISFIATIMLLGGAEGGLRLYGFYFEGIDIPLVVWNPREDRQLESLDALHRTDTRCLWVPRTHAVIPWSSGESVNAGGYRGPLLEPEPMIPPFRVAFLGDSSTFGWGVRDDQTYAAACAAALEAKGIPTESLNAGVVGYSIVQGVARYRELVRAHEPDVVVIAFGAINDHVFGPGQESDREKILNSESMDGWLNRLGDWGRARFRVAHFVSWLQFKRDGGKIALRRRYQEDNKSELTNLENVGKRDYPGVRRVSVTEYRRHLEELVLEIEEDGARVILLSVPRKLAAEKEFPVLIDYSHATEAAATRRSVPLVNVRAHFRSYGEDEEPHIFFDYWHPRPAAHGLIAEDLKPLLLSIAAERGHPR